MERKYKKEKTKIKEDKNKQRKYEKTQLKIWEREGNKEKKEEKAKTDKKIMVIVTRAVFTHPKHLDTSSTASSPHENLSL